MIRYDGFIMYFPLEELTKIVNLGKKLGQKAPFSCHDPYFVGYFWISLSFHREDSKISNMTKYAEFITYFLLDELTKIVNLCKTRAKRPLFHAKTPIWTVIFRVVSCFSQRGT